MLRIAISSWTMHGCLGQVFYEHENGTAVNKNETSSKAMPLIDLPALVAQDGIHTLEICHFHFPHRDVSYLNELKSALDESNVELANLLIDTGNLSNPNVRKRRRDIEMIKKWQEVACQLGARGTRIDCGTEPATPITRKLSADALRELADFGAGLNLATSTENWRTTSLEAKDLLDIMEQAQRPLQLCVDFGNAEKTADKYATLAALMPHGTSLHCKGHFEENQLDKDELFRSLTLAKEAEFDGHMALIYDQTDAEWEKVLVLKEALEEFYPELKS